MTGRFFAWGGMHPSEAEPPLKTTDETRCGPVWRAARLCVEAKMKKQLTIGLLVALTLTSPVWAEEVDEIVVSATGIPTPISQIGSSVDVITAEDLEQQQITYLQDALATVAGVSTYQSGGPGSTSNVFMRGMTGKYSGVYVDGVQINDPTSQQAAWAYLPTHGLESVEVLRGSQGVLYGSEAIGGAISLFTAVGGERQNKAAFEGGSFGTNNIALSSRGKFNDLGYGLAIKQTDSDGISAANENDGNNEKDGYESLSARGRFVLDVSENLSFDLALRSVSSEIETDASGPADDPDDYTDFDALGGRALITYDRGNASHNLSFGQSEDITTSNTFAKTTKTGERSAASYRGIFDVFDEVTFLVGLETEDEELTNANGSSYKVSTDTAYALIQYASENGQSASIAVRRDDHEKFGNFETFRIAGRKMFGSLGIRASYGTGFRAPSLNENFGEANYCLDGICGNSDLQPEESKSSDIALVFEPNRYASIEVAVFDIEIADLIAYGAVVPSDPNAPCLVINQLFTPGATTCGRNLQSNGDSKSQGYEARFVYQITDTTKVSGNYTKLDAEKVDGSRDIRRPEDTLNVSATHSVSESFQIGGQLKLVRNNVDTNFSTFPYVDVDLDDYTLLNLNVAYQINEEVNAYARLENALDDDYETALGFGTPGRAFYVGVSSSF